MALHPDVVPVEDKVRRRLLEEFAKHQVALARALYSDASVL